MGIEDYHITAMRRILTLLSWGRLLKAGVVALITIILIFGWTARGLLLEQKTTHDYNKASVLKVSPDIRNEIDDLVKKNDSIVGIQIVTANFQKNIRIETYASLDSPALQTIYDRYMNNKVVETALFDENKVNNNRIIRLISGEFVCVPYRESSAYTYAPEAESIVSTVCATGIPPSYGEFTGILTIYLKDKPDKDFTEQLFLLSRSLSVRIFDDNKTINENRSQH